MCEILLNRSYTPYIREFSKRGVPVSLRGRVWKRMLEVCTGEKVQQHFNRLKQVLHGTGLCCAQCGVVCDGCVVALSVLLCTVYCLRCVMHACMVYFAVVRGVLVFDVVCVVLGWVVVCHGVVWCCVAWRGVVCDVAWPGVVWFGVEWSGVVWCGR